MATNPIVISRRQNLWGRVIARLSRDLGMWLYVAVVLGLVSVLAFAYLAEASYVAGQVADMAKLEGDLDELYEENSILLLDIAEAEDMSRITAQARAMGFGEATRIEYVVVVLDDTQPATEDDTSGANSIWPSASPWGKAASSLRLVSAISEQLQGWISGGTAGSVSGTRSGAGR